MVKITIKPPWWENMFVTFFQASNKQIQEKQPEHAVFRDNSQRSRTKNIGQIARQGPGHGLQQEFWETGVLEFQRCASSCSTQFFLFIVSRFFAGVGVF